MESKTIHPFEKAGLGTAPFQFVGHEERTFCAGHGAPIQPGSTCDYCGTAIIGCYWLVAADGSRFKVGCDCVRKTTSKGTKVLSDVEKAATKAKKEWAAKRLRERLDALYAHLDASPEFLRDKPHPRRFAGLTLRDWAEWMLSHSGAKGCGEVLRAVGNSAMAGV